MSATTSISSGIDFSVGVVLFACTSAKSQSLTWLFIVFFFTLAQVTAEQVSVTPREVPSIIDHHFHSGSFSSDSSLEEPPLTIVQSRHKSEADQFVASVVSWASQHTVSDQCVSDLFAMIGRELSRVGAATELSISQFAAKIPQNLREAHTLLSPYHNTNLELEEHVVCRECHSVYCMPLSEIPDVCTHISAPDHTQRDRRAQCGEALFSKPPSGKSARQPIMTYPYVPLKESIQNILARPGLVQQCQRFHPPRSDTGAPLLADIYDGKMWKQFLSVDGKPFLHHGDPNVLNLAFQINVDWFQPFTRTQYSVGGIYLTILNLPRSVRYKLCNTILGGIIPGPKEPKLHMNSFLAPLVDDLLSLWEGIEININDQRSGHPTTLQVRGALISVVCDIPALSKLAGFLSHTATIGCSKCLKEFPTVAFGDKTNYSGFDRENWPTRDDHTHRLLAREYLRKAHRSQQKQFESQHGFRYSELLRLPYFDIVNCCTVDPMHNLFEGTAKYFLNLLQQKKVLTKELLHKIEVRVLAIKSLKDVGRLPLKIASGFAGFKADQWRNWTVIYSEIALRGVIPAEHYDCWCQFAKACQILCTRVIYSHQVEEADRLLQSFCVTYSQLFSTLDCTMNMHKHLHLKECMEYFGPIYGFWCFPFERFNGKLSSYHTNSKSIEVQIARKFLRDQCLSSSEMIESSHSRTHDLPCTLTERTYKNVCNLQSCVLPVRPFLFSLNEVGTSTVTTGPGRSQLLSMPNQHLILSVYEALYGSLSEFKLLSLVQVEAYTEVQLCGDRLTTRASSSTLVSVLWPPTCEPGHATEKRIGKITGLFKHTLTSRTLGTIEHLFAQVEFYSRHPNEHLYDSNRIVVTWTQVDVETTRLWKFVPIHRIAGICAYGELPTLLPNGLEQTLLVCNILPLNFTIED